MRNLKKVLSLALALVMLLGMMVIGAGAATSYTDADQISNLQAAEVADALKIIEGNNGQFMPTTELDRAQAAQILARMMLGPDVAKTLTATNNKFVDAQGHWAAAAINYCANNGIVEGDGAVHFYPDNKVTGFQFAKMLLVALGYDAAVEGYNGSGWRTNVALDALQAGLTQNIQVSDAVLTRDAAVQMVFNCLTADMVYYTLKTDTFGQLAKMTNTKTNGDYRISGATVPGGSSTPTNNSDGWMQFCELHFPQLKLVEGDNDAFGNLIAQWKIVEGNKATTISSTDVGYAVQYTAAVTQSKIYTDLGMTAPAVTIPLWVDGVVNSTFTLTNSPALVAGNGAVTTVWMNNRGEASRITVKNTYIGDVTAINATMGTVTIMKRNAGDVGTSGTFAATGLNVGDVVLYTMAGAAKRIMSAEKVTPVTGVLNGYTTGIDLAYHSDGNAIVDSTTYSYSAKLVNQAGAGSLKRSVSVFLDKYGYVIDVLGEVAAPNYAYVLGIGSDPYTGETTRGARLLLADGRVVNVRTAASNAGLDYDIVSYTVNQRGEYALTSLQAGVNENITNALASAVAFTTRTSSIVNVGGATAGTTTSAVTGTGNTIFMVNTPSGYKIYKGIANVPTITGLASQARTALAYCATGNIADVVYIDASDATKTSVSGIGTSVIWVLGGGISDTTNQNVGNDNQGAFYVYYGIVDGVPSAIYARDMLTAAQMPALFTDVVYEETASSTGLKIARLGSAAATTGTGVEVLTNGVVRVGGTNYVTMAANAKVFEVRNGQILVSAPSSIQTAATDAVWWNGVNNVADLVVIVKGAGTVTPPTPTGINWINKDATNYYAAPTYYGSTAPTPDDILAMLTGEGCKDISYNVSSGWTFTTKGGLKIVGRSIAPARVFKATISTMNNTVTEEAVDYAIVSLSSTYVKAGDTLTVTISANGTANASAGAVTVSASNGTVGIPANGTTKADGTGTAVTTGLDTHTNGEIKTKAAGGAVDAQVTVTVTTFTADTVISIAAS